MTETQQFKHIKLASFQKAKEGNYYCGDVLYYFENEDYFICAVSDGLGSGPLAREASNIAISYISENHDKDLETLMNECNKLLLNTRGIVLSIIKIDYRNKEIIYSNRGNINCIFYSNSGRLTRTLPKRGFLCGRKCSFTTQLMPYENGMRFLLYTDGIELPSTLHKTIATEKSVIEVVEFIKRQSDFKKDDVTILVADVLERV